MTVSAARQEASRNNGKKSRGPTSAVGKARSARNSTKHGLTGKGTCLPPELEADRDARAASLADALQPADDAERLLIDQMALAAARIDASVRQESAHSAERRRKALEKFDAERDSHVAHRITQLATEPAGAVEWLLDRAEGCDALSDLWDGLVEALTDDGSWSPDDLRLAMQLHGIGDGQGPDDAGPEVRAMLGDAFALRPGSVAPAERRDRLRRYAESERDRLLARADELWESQDAPARAAVAARVTIGVDDASVRLRQYESAASSSLHRALRDLTALRKAPARAAAARNEPEPRHHAGPIATAKYEPDPRPIPTAENEPRPAAHAPAANEPDAAPPAPAENEPRPAAATSLAPAQNEPRPVADRPVPPPVTRAENEPKVAGRPWSGPPLRSDQRAA